MSIQIGRVVLNESAIRPFDESWSGDGRTVTLSGILFNSATNSVARMTALHDDVLGLPESLVPVIFDAKSHRNAFYTVLSTESSLVHLTDQQIVQLSWKIDLRREGSPGEIDLEARLSGPVNRLNDHTLGGERWFSPNGGAASLWAGAASPSIVSRGTAVEGAIPVYRPLAEGITSVRWYSSVTDYAKGRARVFSDAFERAGIGVALNVNSCWIRNSLAEVELKGANVTFRYYDGTTNLAKDFDLMVNGAALPRPMAASVIYNQYDRVTMRCLWNVVGVGRVTADFTVRRGSRFVEIIMKSATATTMGIRRTQAEAAAQGAGFVRALANDASGDRFIIGSSRTFTGDLTQGGISRAATTRLDAFIGAELNGTTAQAGDTGADLMAQYLGSPSVTVVAVRR